MTNAIDLNAQREARNSIVAASQDEQVVALAASIEAQIGYGDAVVALCAALLTNANYHPECEAMLDTFVAHS